RVRVPSLLVAVPICTTCHQPQQSSRSLPVSITHLHLCKKHVAYSSISSSCLKRFFYVQLFVLTNHLLLNISSCCRTQYFLIFLLKLPFLPRSRLYLLKVK